VLASKPHCKSQCCRFPGQHREAELGPSSTKPCSQAVAKTRVRCRLGHEWATPLPVEQTTCGRITLPDVAVLDLVELVDQKVADTLADMNGTLEALVAQAVGLPPE
jgi:hypothetical protein